MELWQQRCDTSLGLGTDLALLTSVQDGNGDQNSCFQRDEGKSKVNLHVHLPTVQLNLMLHSTAPESPSTPQLSRQHSSPKNERAIDVNKVPSAADGDEGGPAGKKLRLSKEQSSLLEQSFKEHPTLNPKQKLALAKRLDLSHRQVEVWFQNRRARTKLKQTEVDCEFLKRCCDSLKEENRRLKKELQELRALKMPASPYYMGMPPATLTMCPSCESQREVERLRHHHNNKDSL